MSNKEVLLSPSSRNEFDPCSLKGFFVVKAKSLGLPRDWSTTNAEKNKPKNDASLTGNVFHALVEARNLNLGDPKEYASSLYEHYPEDCDRGTAHCYKYLDLTWSGYCKNYPIEKEFTPHTTDEGVKHLESHWVDEEVQKGSVFKDQGFKDQILFVESNKEFEKKTGHDPKILLGRSIKRGGETILADTKTTSQTMGTSWILNLKTGIQFPIYAKHQYRTDPLYNGLVMVDGVHHSKNKRIYKRIWFDYSKSQINKRIKQSNDLIKASMKDPKPDFSACFAWGRPCKFYELCHSIGYNTLDYDERLETFLKDVDYVLDKN